MFLKCHHVYKKSIKDFNVVHIYNEIVNRKFFLTSTLLFRIQLRKSKITFLKYQIDEISFQERIH